jgi:hypothetical protein
LYVLELDSRVLYGFEGNLQKDPLLGIHCGSLDWRNGEKLIIELVDFFIHKVAMPDICQPLLGSTIRFVEAADIESSNLFLNVSR